MTYARFTELKRLYPSSAILERASGIVGPKTLKVNWVAEDDSVGTKRYETGETVPLIAISEDSQLQINIGLSLKVKKVIVNHEVFSDWV